MALINRNTITLTGAVIVSLGFFIAGLTNVLDYYIVKILLFTGFSMLLCLAIVTVLQKASKKNRLENSSQDDSININ